MAVFLAPERRRFLKRAAAGLLVLVLVYLIVAYLLLPLGWVRYAHRHAAWEDAPRVTHTVADIPGDPLNVALVGTEAEVKKILLAAGWYPADPLTLKSCLEMAEAALLKGRTMTRRSATCSCSAARRTWPSSNRSAITPGNVTTSASDPLTLKSCLATPSSHP